MSEDDLEHGSGNDQAVEPVEGRLKVDSWSQGPHSEQHFKNEQAQEEKLSHICKEAKRKECTKFLFSVTFSCWLHLKISLFLFVYPLDIFLVFATRAKRERGPPLRFLFF